MRFPSSVAALLLLLCMSTDALAHASLVSTEPRDGSMVAQAPQTVRLRFNEPVTPAVIRVIDSEGTTRSDAAVHAANDTVEIALPTGLPAGTQVISYRVISADGHPVAGSIMFSIGMGKSAAAPADSDATLAILIWLSRIGLYLGLFVGVVLDFHFEEEVGAAHRLLFLHHSILGECPAPFARLAGRAGRVPESTATFAPSAAAKSAR